MRCALEKGSFCKENGHKNKCPCGHSMPEYKNNNDSKFVIPILNHKNIAHDSWFASTQNFKCKWWIISLMMSRFPIAKNVIRVFTIVSNEMFLWLRQNSVIHSNYEHFDDQTFISNAPVHFYIEYQAIAPSYPRYPNAHSKYRHLYLLVIKEPKSKQNQEPCYDVISIF